MKEIMNQARKTGKVVVSVTPNYCGQGVTEWTATPKENGAVELTYRIITRPKLSS